MESGKRMMRLYACIVAATFLVGIFTPTTVRRGYRAFGRGVRKWGAIKAVNDTMTHEILPVIEESEFPVAMILALIETESGGYWKAKSPEEKHVGLMMVWLGHAKTYGYAEDDLFDPVVNVTIGIDILRQRVKKYKGVEYYYISAYNTSDANLQRLIDKGTPLPKETRTHWYNYRRRKKKYDDWIDGAVWEEDKGYRFAKR